MNRELLFRILQVAVVAPWLYSISNRTRSNYFRTGLKLVAGTIIWLNAPGLYQEAIRAGWIAPPKPRGIEIIPAGSNEVLTIIDDSGTI